MAESEIWTMDATALAESIRMRALSPVEVVTAFLDRIDRLQPVLNAFTVVLHESALAEASAAAKAVQAGDELGPLHGVPIALKDITDTAGILTTLGSPLFRERRPPADGVLAERTRQAGAVLVGKTQMSELTHSAHTQNPVFGATLNPWSVDHTPGGSSGGAAVAVAAGLVPIADATDGGGSIRIPASCCGCYGFKPSHGRIPARLYATSFDSLTVLGPITWTVRDAALLLEVWQGADDRDPLSLPTSEAGFVSALETPLEPAAIALVDFGVSCDGQVARVVERTVDTLAELGHSVTQVAVDGFAEAERAWSVTYWSMFSALYGRYRHDREQMSASVLQIIEDGMELTAVEFHEAQVVRSRFYDRVSEVLETYDFILTPTLSVPPPTVGELEAGSSRDSDDLDPQLGWYLTWPFNLTMHPAASIPAGRTIHGLPIGVQLVGRRHRDQELLQISAQLEEANPWRTYRPPLVSIVEAAE